MAVNTSKTKYIIFRTHGKFIDPDQCRIVFNSNVIGQEVNIDLIKPIDRVHGEGAEKSFKLLGVYLDEYLSFNAHVSQLCAKISKSLFCLNRLKNIVTSEALRTLYFAMIHSNDTTLKPLILKQKQAIRVVSNAGYRDHTAPLFAKHKILPVNELIYLCKAKFMHSYMFGRLPPSFYEMWQTNRERNVARELRNTDDLYVRPHRIELFKRMPLISFANAWNSIDARKHNPSQKVFLKQLKNELLAGIVVV
jgi:hypothetical protein